jgi:hypothetical protein
MSRRRPAPSPSDDDEMDEGDSNCCSDNVVTESEQEEEMEDEEMAVRENTDPVTGAVAGVISAAAASKRKSHAHFSEYENGAIKRLSLVDFM